MTAFFNVVGTLEEFRQAFTMAVIIGRSSLTHSLRRKVRIGSNVQDFVVELSYFPNFFWSCEHEFF